MYCVLDSLTLFSFSAIGQEHEVLLRDKLKERNLSFLGKPFYHFQSDFVKMFLYTFVENLTELHSLQRCYYLFVGKYIICNNILID